jgi:hypothetical protein
MGVPGPQFVVFWRRVGLPDETGLARRLLQYLGTAQRTLVRPADLVVEGHIFARAPFELLALFGPTFIGSCFGGAPSLAAVLA